MHTIYQTPDYEYCRKVQSKWKLHHEEALKSVENILNASKAAPRMPFFGVLKYILGTILLITLISLSTCKLAHAEASMSKIEGFTLNQWVNAIHKAEGNDNYGILSVSCETTEACRRVCANTVRNNYKRWQRSGKTVAFLQFLQRRYAPVGVSNDPGGLNRNWARNVSYFLTKGA